MAGRPAEVQAAAGTHGAVRALPTGAPRTSPPHRRPIAAPSPPHRRPIADTRRSVRSASLPACLCCWRPPPPTSSEAATRARSIGDCGSRCAHPAPGGLIGTISAPTAASRRPPPTVASRPSPPAATSYLPRTSAPHCRALALVLSGAPRQLSRYHTLLQGARAAGLRPVGLQINRPPS